MKRTGYIILLITIILASCMSKIEKAEKYFDNGKEKIYLSKFEEAISDFNMAIENNPEYVEAYFFRGNCKINLRDSEGAIEDYSKTIELMPDYTEAYYNRANANLYLGNKEAACKDWKKAIELGKPNIMDKIKGCM